MIDTAADLEALRARAEFAEARADREHRALLNAQARANRAEDRITTLQGQLADARLHAAALRATVDRVHALVHELRDEGELCAAQDLEDTLGAGR